MKEFGVYSVMGNFGSGKTFWTFLEISQLDKNKNLIIANVPYKFVDVPYSTASELYDIIEDLEFYVDKSNEDVLWYYKNRRYFKNIVIVVDEAHLYFNSRHWGKKWKWDVPLIDRLDIILTQCRKRNIKIVFISQRLKRVDINIRRMTDFVVRYKKKSIPILWIQWSKKTIYENEWDLADIQGDDTKTYVANDSWGTRTDIEKSKLSSSQFLPLLKIFWFPLWKYLSQWQFYNFQNEQHNSYFISWLVINGTKNGFQMTDIICQNTIEQSSDKEKKIQNWLLKNIPSVFQKLKDKNTQNIDNSWKVFDYVKTNWIKEDDDKKLLKFNFKTRW